MRTESARWVVLCGQIITYCCMVYSVESTKLRRFWVLTSLAVPPQRWKRSPTDRVITFSRTPTEGASHCQWHIKMRIQNRRRRHDPPPPADGCNVDDMYIRDPSHLNITDSNMGPGCLIWGLNLTSPKQSFCASSLDLQILEDCEDTFTIKLKYGVAACINAEKNANYVLSQGYGFNMIQPGQKSLPQGPPWIHPTPSRYFIVGAYSGKSIVEPLKGCLEQVLETCSCEI